MTEMRDWRRNRSVWIRALEAQTGQGLSPWNRRIRTRRPVDERTLRSWLTNKNVTGYAQSLLVMEYFGYPDFVPATAEELIAQQYADRQQLGSIYNAVGKSMRRGHRPGAQDIRVPDVTAPDLRARAADNKDSGRCGIEAGYRACCRAALAHS